MLTASSTPRTSSLTACPLTACPLTACPLMPVDPLTACPLTACPLTACPLTACPLTSWELQIKFAGFAVITTDAVRWMKNIIQDLPCVEVGAGHDLITREPTTWGMLPTMRHGIIAKTSNLDPAPICGACMEREKNPPIDELSLRDQRLQQVDTIMAELQDKIIQSKRNTTLLNAQQNEAQSAL